MKQLEEINEIQNRIRQLEDQYREQKSDESQVPVLAQLLHLHWQLYDKVLQLILTHENDDTYLELYKAHRRNLIDAANQIITVQLAAANNKANDSQLGEALNLSEQIVTAGKKLETRLKAKETQENPRFVKVGGDDLEQHMLENLDENVKKASRLRDKVVETRRLEERLQFFEYWMTKTPLSPGSISELRTLAQQIQEIMRLRETMPFQEQVLNRLYDLQRDLEYQIDLLHAWERVEPWMLRFRRNRTDAKK